MVNHSWGKLQTTDGLEKAKLSKRFWLNYLVKWLWVAYFSLSFVFIGVESLLCSSSFVHSESIISIIMKYIEHIIYRMRQNWNIYVIDDMLNVINLI